MKSLLVLFFILLIFNSLLIADNLDSASGNGSNTLSASGSWADVATTISIDLTSVDKVLVYATFTSEITESVNQSRTMTYRLHDNSSTVKESNMIERYMSGTKDVDKGIGSLVYIFDVASMDNTSLHTFSSEHQVDTNFGTKTDATIHAIALNTDSAPYYPLLSNDVKTIVGAVGTTSTTFEGIATLTTGAVTLNTDGDVLVIASLNTRSQGSGATGTWTLQSSPDNSNWSNIGTPISRTLSGNNDMGITNLIALDHQSTGDYYYRVAHKTDSNEIQTLNSSLAAVSLGYLKGGTEVRKFSGSSVQVVSATTINTTAETAATINMISVGSKVLLLAQYGVSASAVATGNYTLSADNSTTSTQVMKRYLADDLDKGSGSIVGIVSGTPSNYYLQHYLSGSGPTLTSSNIEFVALNLTDIHVGGVLPVTLSTFTASFVDDQATLLWSTASESNNLGWNVYRSISQNYGQALQVNSGLITGAGNSTVPTYYNYVDEGLNDYIEQLDLGSDAVVWYWIESISNNGATETHGPVMLQLPQDDFDPEFPDLPVIYGLQQNYPNPFNPNTTISFNLNTEGTENTEIIILNIKGQMVRSFDCHPEFIEGSANQSKYSLVWDGTDNSGIEVPSGVYLYKVKSGDFEQTKKMLLLK
ncbi:T9SS type A sorting domain-containing protein [Candidatus Cloacimonadota bacterium]